MFKRILEEYLKNRLNAIDLRIEELANNHVASFEDKTIIQRETYELPKESIREISKLQIKATLYNVIFNGIS